MQAPSGQQFEIERGAARATVTEVGATLRDFHLDGVPVLWGFPETAIASAGRGQVLAPWPNRLEDGRYSFRGVAGQAPLDEPERDNAIHGLVRWLQWQVVHQESDLVELACVLAPQPAYPFRLHLSITYALDAVGLNVTARAESADGSPAPFALGFHPYFLAVEQGLAGARLSLPAKRHLLLDHRGLPVGDEAVPPELRGLVDGEGSMLDDLVLDDCFTGLNRGVDGTAEVRFFPGDGPIAEVQLVLDQAFGYLMCFTGDTLGIDDRRRAVAIEPMTSPPNALASGRDLIELDAEHVFEGHFHIRPVHAT